MSCYLRHPSCYRVLDGPHLTVKQKSHRVSNSPNSLLPGSQRRVLSELSRPQERKKAGITGEQRPGFRLRAQRLHDQAPTMKKKSDKKKKKHEQHPFGAEA